MAAYQRADGLLQVRPRQRGDGGRGPTDDLGRSGATVGCRRPERIPGLVAASRHRGHRIGVDEDAIREVIRRMSAPGPPRLELLAGGRRSVSGPELVGLLPGSFDPLTTGHAGLAEALHRAGAGLVLLVYAVRTLPKERPGPPPLLPPERRLAALAAYCRGRRHLAPAAASHGLYADQAEAAASLFPGARILLGMGADKVRQLLDPRWYEDRDAALERLFRVADVAYAPRGGEDPPLEELVGDRAEWIGRMRRLQLPPGLGAVSSSDVRARLRRGGEPGSDIPREVHPFLADR